MPLHILGEKKSEDQWYADRYAGYSQDSCKFNELVCWLQLRLLFQVLFVIVVERKYNSSGLCLIDF